MANASESATVAHAGARAAASHWALSGTAAPPECTAPPGANIASLRGQGWRAVALLRRRFGRTPAPARAGCTAGCRDSWRTPRPPARCP
eukprot:scaffold137986_cov115-Phaeocystis_antarctica.AAC.2